MSGISFLSGCTVLAVGAAVGGMIGSKINKRLKEENVSYLFLVLMLVAINIYHAVKFGVAWQGGA